MQSLKIAVVACSLFVAAAGAYAQNETPAANASQQVSQANAPQSAATPAQRETTRPAKKDDCVGPVSFCNLYFGS